jgi:hypothetical protein
MWSIWDHLLCIQRLEGKSIRPFLNNHIIRSVKNIQHFPNACSIVNGSQKYYYILACHSRHPLRNVFHNFGISTALMASLFRAVDLQSTIYKQLSSSLSVLFSSTDFRICTWLVQFWCTSECTWNSVILWNFSIASGSPPLVCSVWNV